MSETAAVSAMKSFERVSDSRLISLFLLFARKWKNREKSVCWTNFFPFYVVRCCKTVFVRPLF